MRPASHSASPAGSTAISRMGELMNRLQEVAQRDPAQFQALAARTSQDLEALAIQSPDGSAPWLSDLSARFANAASSRDPAAIMRTPPGSKAAPTQAALSAVSAKIDAVFNLRPPPLGPWFPK
jgi:hypothetical protein